MSSHFIYASALMLISSAVAAAPTITGNSISWPDDGWYQVQQVTSNGIVEVCREGLSCEVEDGEYIVINHTTNERFEGIIVPASTQPDSVTYPDEVTIAGNLITWPNDGWYQVLDESDYTEICGGTTSCEVGPGSYLVINHTTGVRIENVLIGETNQPDSGIVVNGFNISWPDDGWYQVQDSITHESVCNGGSSCEVPAGTYKVINHTTGMVYSNFRVTGDDTGVPPTDEPDNPPDPAEFNLLDDSRGLIANLAGYELDQLAVVVDDMAYWVEQETTIVWPDSDYYQVQKAAPNFSTGVAMYESVCVGEAVCQLVPGTYIVINQTSGERTILFVPYERPADLAGSTVLEPRSFTYQDIEDSYAPATVNVERRQYNCEGGGTMIRETGEERLFTMSGESTPNGVQFNGYLFDQCEMTMTGGLLPNDTYVLQGDLTTIASRGFALSTGERKFQLYNYDTFTINADSGLTYIADAKIENYTIRENNASGPVNAIFREASVAIYEKLSIGGQPFASVIEGEFSYQYGPNFLLDASGSVSNELTANQTVSFNTDSPLSGYFLSTAPEMAIPFVGLLTLQAEDGSTLNIEASPTEEDAFAIRKTYTVPEREPVQSNGAALRYLSDDFNCEIASDNTTKRLSCAGSGDPEANIFFVIP